MMNNTDAYIYFDKDTNFSGEVESPRVILEGRIDGVIHAEKEVHLKKGASIKGDIFTGHFKADKGSTYFGELQVEQSEKTVEKEGNGKAKNRKNLFMKVASILTAL